MANVFTRIFHLSDKHQQAEKKALFWLFLPLAVLTVLSIGFSVLQASLRFDYRFDATHQTFITDATWGIALLNIVGSLLVASFLFWIVSLYFSYRHLTHYLDLTRPKTKKASTKRSVLLAAIVCFSLSPVVIMAWIALMQCAMFVVFPATQTVPVFETPQSYPSMVSATSIVPAIAGIAWPLMVIVGVYLLVKRNRK